MNPNLFSIVIDAARTIFSSMKIFRPGDVRALNLLSSKPVEKDKSIVSIEWHNIESSYYDNTRIALNKTYKYLLRQEKRWLMSYISVLISGFLIIIFAIGAMFLLNMVTGIVLLGIGTATGLTSSIFMIQVNSIIKQKIKVTENISDIENIHLSINNTLEHSINI